MVLVQALWKDVFCNSFFPYFSLLLSSATLSLPFLSPCPDLEVRLCFLYLLFLQRCLAFSVLSHLYPQAVFSSSAFYTFSLLPLIGQVVCCTLTQQVAEYYTVIHSLPLLPSGIEKRIKKSKVELVG